MKIVRQVEFSWAYLDKQKAIKMRNEKTNEENLKLHLKQRIESVVKSVEQKAIKQICLQLQVLVLVE